MAREVPVGGVTLHERWRLVPVDERNWELCELRAVADTPAARRSGSVGEERWMRCGRFYQHGTIGNALSHVADRLVAEGCAGDAVGLIDALREWRAVAGSLVATAMESLASGGTPLAAGEAAGDRG